MTGVCFASLLVSVVFPLPGIAVGASGPVLLSFQAVIFSSMAIFVSSSSDRITERSKRTHCRSCLGHLKGSDQSRRIAMRVLGTVFGVKSGLSKGAKDGAGVDSIQMDNLARVSS